MSIRVARRRCPGFCASAGRVVPSGTIHEIAYVPLEPTCRLSWLQVTLVTDLAIQNAVYFPVDKSDIRIKVEVNACPVGCWIGLILPERDGCTRSAGVK